MKAIIGGAAGVVALGGALLLANTRSTPSAVQASSPASTVATSANAQNPLLVNCGEGRQPLVRAAAPGQQFAQVECVAAPVMVPQGYVPMASYMVAPGSYPATEQPVVYQDRVVYRDRPVYRTRTVSRNRTSYRQASYSPNRTDRRMRSWKKSALIIGGSAAGGAGVGAILGGKSGAKKGAIVGGIGGLVYDMATRNK